MRPSPTTDKDPVRCLPGALPDAWNEAVDCTARLVCRYQRALEPAGRAAASILAHMECLFPLLDHLCRATCPACELPCCRHAVVCFDHADLIFLLLTGQDVPRTQPRPKPCPGRSCAYLTAAGCRLPRSRRPWICTWYICPDQKRFLKGDDAGRLARRIAAIKCLRKEMEDTFITVVTPGPIQTGRAVICQKTKIALQTVVTRFT